jgi:hypothetical protein
MGFFSRNRDVSTTPQSPSSTLGPNDVIPANATWKDRIAYGSNQALNKATDIYNRNPKLVGGLAVLAGAAILAGIKKRGRMA